MSLNTTYLHQMNNIWIKVYTTYVTEQHFEQKIVFVETQAQSYKFKRFPKSRWDVQKASRWNVLFLCGAHAVLFASALLSGFLYKRSG